MTSPYASKGKWEYNVTNQRETGKKKKQWEQQQKHF